METRFSYNDVHVDLFCIVPFFVGEYLLMLYPWLFLFWCPN
ncbi:hypothetical protein PPIS_a2336 [Pseudoalteromonas piscicida]|uniref:Uncharacterized protein n=1 Tax=Pseudoalteromonas piscicida TaxID=43662 RepID=A0ABM6NEC8_PSEO7|nr:hypothetical protein PPIS_a2336 [Pseudoalteromonas piscicida]